MPEMFANDVGSDTVKVNPGVSPKPAAGLTEMAMGDPPVTFQLPTETHPELALGSRASRYTLCAPVKAAAKARFTSRTTEFPDGYARVYPTAHWPFDSVAEEP